VARAGTGEDWSERIAAELAHRLGLPHASYEFATWRGRRGTVSPTFVPEQATLVHGNELLLKAVPVYGGSGKYRVSQHTVDLVLDTIRDAEAKTPLDWTPPAGVLSAVEVFVGYLLLDALIGNTDRHHENWGIIEQPAGGTTTRYLAPTYDHASSMGRNEPDKKIARRLPGRDSGYNVEAYALHARSARQSC